MQRFILHRFIQAIICILVVSIVVFLMGRLSGNPVDLMLPLDATEQDRAIMMKHLGLDRPLPYQYGIFIKNALKGDFGESVRMGRPTIDIVLERFPATLELASTAMIISLVVAVPIGVYAAVRRRGVLDFGGRMFAVLGQAMPAFWLGIMLIYLFAVFLGVLPAGGRGGPEYLILPAITLGWAIAAGIMRLTRSSMLEVLGTDYVKLARIKGVSESKVIWKHAFKNAAIPVLTYVVMIFAIILGGTVVVETVFSWPGVGRLVVESVYARDFPVVQTVVILLSVLFIVANLVVDVLYAYLNPKIRYGQ